MSREPRLRSGMTGLLILFSAALLAAGLGFDFGAQARRAFWIGAAPGGAAAIGVGAALFVVLAAQALRWALQRRARQENDDAGDHA